MLLLFDKLYALKCFNIDWQRGRVSYVQGIKSEVYVKTETEIGAQRSRRLRVSGNDFAAMQEILAAAALLITPEDQTQRQSFAKMMPELYVLRDKGCSFEQITTLLNRCGLRLQPSTVKNYYNEMLVTRQEICQERMSQQILLLAELKRETQGVDVAAMKDRLDAINAQNRVNAAGKIDALFPGQTTAPKPTNEISHNGANELNTARIAKPGRRPTEVPQTAVEAEKPANRQQTNAPVGFSSMESAETEPYVRPIDTPTASPIIRKLKCRPLQAGIIALKRRDKVPSEVYQSGTLEHPAIVGLELTMEERVYGAALEYVSLDDGVVHLETAEEKRFRIKWQKPIPMSSTRTSHSFVRMDDSLFLTRK